MPSKPACIVLPAVGAAMAHHGLAVAVVRRNQDVNDGHVLRPCCCTRFALTAPSNAAATAPTTRARRPAGRCHHRGALIHGVAPGDERTQGLNRRIVQLAARRDGVAELRNAVRFSSGMDVIRAKFSNRPFLRYVRKADLLACNGLGKRGAGPFLPLGPLKQSGARAMETCLPGSGSATGLSGSHCSGVNRATFPHMHRPHNLQVIPWLIGHPESDRLAGKHVAVPVRKLDVVVAVRQRGAVIDAGPGGLPGCRPFPSTTSASGRKRRESQPCVR